MTRLALGELIYTRVIRLTLELFVVAGVISKLIGEFQDAIEAKKLHGTYVAYFGVWNILDCISITMYTICIMYWLVRVKGSGGAAASMAIPIAES